MNLVFAIGLLFLSFSTQALTNSTFADEVEFGTVVFIKSEGLDQNGEEALGFCNGTFISAQVILTAAHCIAQSEALQKRATTIQFGSYKYVQKPNGERVRVGYRATYEFVDLPQFRFLPSVTEKIRRMGARVTVAPGEDIAQIILSKPVDLVALGLRASAVVSSGEWATIKNSISSYHPTVVSINYVAELTNNDSKKKATLNALKVLGPNIESTSSSRVQPGDSGSPLFVRIGTEWKIAAVTKGMAKSFFSEWDMFTVAPGQTQALRFFDSPATF